MAIDFDPKRGGDQPGAEPARSAAQQARRDEIRRQIEHRFRYSLRMGGTNPLLHLVTRYRLDNLEASP